MGKWSIWRKNRDNMANEDGMESNTAGGEGMTGESGAKTEEQMYIPGGVDRLDAAVGALITEILGCEEYLVYREELDRVLKIPNLKEQIDEYRRRNYELQSSMDIDFDKLDRFEKEYENFRSDPAVSDFLAAELAFCRRMQAIETRVTAELDFQ